MFKRVLESLSKSLGGGKSAAPKKLSPPAKPAQTPPAKSGSLLDKVGGPAKPAAPAQRARPAATPEEMCGITAKMTKDQIGARLKLLYRRYNRGASSLDKKVSEEAERMLDAIVAIREKTFGEL